MLTKKTKDRIARIFAILMCLVLTAQGIVSIYKSEWSYRNYWGGLVFGPIAILIGILLIYLLLFRWDKLQKDIVDKKGREIKFPHDDFRKW